MSCRKIGELRVPVSSYIYFLLLSSLSSSWLQVTGSSLQSPLTLFSVLIIATFEHGQTHLLQRICSWRPHVYKNPQNASLILAKGDRCFCFPVHMALTCDDGTSSFYLLGLPTLKLCCSRLNFYFLIHSNFATKWDCTPYRLCNTCVIEMHIKCRHDLLRFLVLLLLKPPLRWEESREGGCCLQLTSKEKNVIVLLFPTEYIFETLSEEWFWPLLTSWTFIQDPQILPSQPNLVIGSLNSVGKKKKKHLYMKTYTDYPFHFRRKPAC